METLSLLDQIKSFVEIAENLGNIEKIRETIKYVNNDDENDFFLNIDEALERGLNLGNYQKVVITTNPKNILTAVLTDKQYIYKEDIVVLEKAVKFAKKIVHSHIEKNTDLQNETKMDSKTSKKLKK